MAAEPRRDYQPMDALKHAGQAVRLALKVNHGLFCFARRAHFDLVLTHVYVDLFIYIS